MVGVVDDQPRCEEYSSLMEIDCYDSDCKYRDRLHVEIRDIKIVECLKQLYYHIRN